MISLLASPIHSYIVKEFIRNLNQQQIRNTLRKQLSQRLSNFHVIKLENRNIALQLLKITQIFIAPQLLKTIPKKKKLFSRFVTELGLKKAFNMLDLLVNSILQLRT